LDFDSFSEDVFVEAVVAWLGYAAHTLGNGYAILREIAWRITL
jgi:hypothetical protein